jgi:hypothetical protein
MWQDLENLKRIVVEQWARLSGSEQTVALILVFAILFYLARTSESYSLITIASLIAFALVVYVAISMLKHI